MSLDTWARTHPDRCPHGFAAAHHPTFCNCSEMGEWVVFTTALRTAARDGKVRQNDVRPLIRGRIEPKHIGQLYKRARREGLLREVDHDRSRDFEGKNAGRLEPLYELRAAA